MPYRNGQLMILTVLGPAIRTETVTIMPSRIPARPKPTSGPVRNGIRTARGALPAQRARLAAIRLPGLAGERLAGERRAGLAEPARGFGHRRPGPPSQVG
jgi:hypothetical protein